MAASRMGPLRLSALGGPVSLLATHTVLASWSPEGARGELHPCLGFWRKGPRAVPHRSPMSYCSSSNFPLPLVFFSRRWEVGELKWLI